MQKAQIEKMMKCNKTKARMQEKKKKTTTATNQLHRIQEDVRSSSM